MRTASLDETRVPPSYGTMESELMEDGHPAQGYRLQNWGKIARAFESTTILRFLGPQYHLTANTESETTDALGALPSSPDGNSLRDRSRISTSVHRLTASLSNLLEISLRENRIHGRQRERR